jgi:hypothetical protein
MRFLDPSSIEIGEVAQASQSGALFHDEMHNLDVITSASGRCRDRPSSSA